MKVAILFLLEAYEIIIVIVNKGFDSVIANAKHRGNQCVKHTKAREQMPQEIL